MKTTLLIRAVSGDNAHVHWREKAARTKAHRFAAKWATEAEMRRNNLADSEWLLSGAGLLVTLTRIAPRPLDTDGNASAMKAVRDGVADAFGLKSDNDERITWAYAQRRGGIREYGVEIEITARAHCASCGQAVSA